MHFSEKVPTAFQNSHKMFLVAAKALLWSNGSCWELNEWISTRMNLICTIKNAIIFRFSRALLFLCKLYLFAHFLHNCQITTTMALLFFFGINYSDIWPFSFTMIDSSKTNTKSHRIKCIFGWFLSPLTS